MKSFENKVYNNMAGMSEDHLLRIYTDDYVSISVVDQLGNEYSDGDLVDNEDILTITATYSENYEKKVLTVNGEAFTSGSTFASSTSVIINATSQGNAYDLARTDTNGTVTVLRDGLAVLDGENVIRYGQTLTITGVPNDGYEFTSLTVNGDTIESGDTFVVGAEDVAIVLTSTIIEYDITYNLDGGVNSVNNPATYTISTATITLEPATKDYHTFGGWYSNSEFTGDAITEIELGSFGDITLYAKLDANEYTITYMDGDTEIVTLTPVAYTYGEGTILPTEVVKESYTFNGWYDNSEFTGDIITAISDTANGNKTFYAKFTLIL